MKTEEKIYVAGHEGLVGSALLRILNEQGYRNIIHRTHQELDLTDQAAVRDFFSYEKPDYVFLAAAKVGGILANSAYPADFIYQNISIQTNVIESARQSRVKRLLFLGSSCVYPRDCSQPIKESYLLQGPLEKTNEAYAIAKIAGIKMCEAYNKQYRTAFLGVMPTNLYGPNDNFNLESAHVIPALIRKFEEARRGRIVPVIWGTGRARREFLYSDDLADACIALMNLPEQGYHRLLSASNNPPVVNIGSGEEITIQDLVQLIAATVGYDGEVRWDSSKPDGTPAKLLDPAQMKALNWTPKIKLKLGLTLIYRWYLDNCGAAQLAATSN